MKARGWKIDDGSWNGSVGTPVSAAARAAQNGAHGVTRPTFRIGRWPLRLCVFTLMLGFSCLGVHAQTNYSIDWHTIDGAGGTSTGGVYSVSGTVGQPDAGGPMTNGQYSVTGGFWVLPTAIQTEGAPTLTITAAGAGQAQVSWSPETGTTWVLQERTSLTSGSWSNSASGSTNPIVVPATGSTRLYRLHKP